MTLPVLDLVFFVIIFAFAIVGVILGFRNELIGKITPVVSIWCAFVFCTNLNEIMEPMIKIHLVSLAVSFLLIFIACFILIKILQSIINKIFDNPIFNSLDKFLGFVLGLVEGTAVVLLVLFLLKMQPWFDTSKILEGSIFLRLFSAVMSLPVENVEMPVINVG